jgi:hypothetical protein
MRGSGALAEWLGSGLQSRVLRFESGRRLSLVPGLELRKVGSRARQLPTMECEALQLDRERSSLPAACD